MLLVGNGYLVTGRHQCQPDGCVAIENELVVETGSTETLRRKYPSARFVDARSRIIMPGLINTHMHLYSTFARGMALKDDSPQNFTQILERLWWRLDKTLTADDVYYSALVPLIECIKNGTTTIFDHHASPSAVPDSLFRVADAANATGLRACLCYEVSDRDGAGVAAQGLEENARFIEHCLQSGDSRLKGMFGLHASFTLSDKTLTQAAEYAARLSTGFHVHTAEAAADVEDSQRRYGKGVVERLHDFGIWGEKTVAAHCVHVSDAEIDLLLATKTNVVHNPESNMGNAVGCAPVLDMMRRGLAVGLGTDGYTCDMFESLKVANLLHKHQAKNPSAAWQEPPTMLFNNNPAIAAHYFEQPLGQLIPGAFADIIIVDYTPPTPISGGNLDGHILFGMAGRSVDTTIVNGKILMLDRQLTTVDEAEIYAKAREQACALWSRF